MTPAGRERGGGARAAPGPLPAWPDPRHPGMSGCPLGDRSGQHPGTQARSCGPRHKRGSWTLPLRAVLEEISMFSRERNAGILWRTQYTSRNFQAKGKASFFLALAWSGILEDPTVCPRQANHSEAQGKQQRRTQRCLTENSELPSGPRLPSTQPSLHPQPSLGTRGSATQNTAG